MSRLRDRERAETLLGWEAWIAVTDQHCRAGLATIGLELKNVQIR